MDIEYVYTKLRKNFGKKCMFSDDGPRILEDIFPDRKLMKKYLIKNPVNKSTQLTQSMSENHANTTVTDYCDHGMNHLEGGWPKEINKSDEEAVLRFRKKVQRLDYYVAAMKHLTAPMEHAILQNNAINIYEQYFKKNRFLFLERVSCRVQNAFRDLNEKPRPVTHCSWSPKKNEFAMSHCYMDYQHPQTINCPQCYVWDIENPNTPSMTFGFDNPIVTLEYNPKDPNCLAAGMFNGLIASFDPRKGPEPTSMCLVEHGHREPVHSVLWVNTKSGMECFSASNDGVIKWWDCRKLDEPIDYVILEMSKEAQSKTAPYPASCIEYEQSIPSKYMVGTQTGHVICGNRKGVNQQEKLPWIMKCHHGPIYSIHRNQAITKHFLTVGDWTARIWTEDCKESAILWTKYHRAKLTGGEWSSGRVSVFFLTREDGVLDLWDILEEQKLAFLSLKLCEQPLTCLRVREDGELVVAASTAGTAYVVRYSSNLAETSKDDRAFLGAMFEREAHREKLLESKNKELRLRLRELAMAKEAPEKPPPVVAVNPLREEAEEKYFVAIEEALHAAPVPAWGSFRMTQGRVSVAPKLEEREFEEDEEEEKEEEEDEEEEQPIENIPMSERRK